LEKNQIAEGIGMSGYVRVVLMAVCGVAALRATDSGGDNGSVELNNGNCQIVFDRERGELLSIRNAILGDECLKGVDSSDAPFRIYADFTQEFEMPDADYTKSFGLGSDIRAMCRTVLGPGDCCLKDVRQDDGLTLTYEGGGEIQGQTTNYANISYGYFTP
jgi:hypothetical protein